MIENPRQLASNYCICPTCHLENMIDYCSSVSFEPAGKQGETRKAGKSKILKQVGFQIEDSIKFEKKHLLITIEISESCLLRLYKP